MKNLDTNLLPDLTQAAVINRELLLWTYTPSKQENLSQLLNTSGYEGRMREELQSDINNNQLSQEDYYLLISKLEQAQVDKITAGLNYSQNDIVNHLRKLC